MVKPRPVWLLAGALLCSRTPLHAQVDSSLIGVPAVDAQVQVGWTDRLLTKVGTSETAKQRILTRFTLELRKLGIVVTPSAPNALVCYLNTMVNDEATIVNWAVSFHFYQHATLSRNGLKLFVQTFQMDNMGNVGIGRVSELYDVVGTWCAERFGNAWLAANPPKR